MQSSQQVDNAITQYINGNIETMPNIYADLLASIGIKGSDRELYNSAIEWQKRFGTYQPFPNESAISGCTKAWKRQIVSTFVNRALQKVGNQTVGTMDTVPWQDRLKSKYTDPGWIAAEEKTLLKSYVGLIDSFSDLILPESSVKKDLCFSGQTVHEDIDTQQLLNERGQVVQLRFPNKPTSSDPGAPSSSSRRSRAMPPPVTGRSSSRRSRARPPILGASSSRQVIPMPSGIVSSSRSSRGDPFVVPALTRNTSSVTPASSSRQISVRTMGGTPLGVPSYESIIRSERKKHTVVDLADSDSDSDLVVVPVRKPKKEPKVEPRRSRKRPREVAQPTPTPNAFAAVERPQISPRKRRREMLMANAMNVLNELTRMNTLGNMAIRPSDSVTSKVYPMPFNTQAGVVSGQGMPPLEDRQGYVYQGF